MIFIQLSILKLTPTFNPVSHTWRFRRKKFNACVRCSGSKGQRKVVIRSHEINYTGRPHQHGLGYKIKEYHINTHKVDDCLPIEGISKNPSTSALAWFTKETLLLGETEETNELHFEDALLEMWLGQEFLDHASFKKALKRFAMYNNFNTKSLKSKGVVITTKCVE